MPRDRTTSREARAHGRNANASAVSDSPIGTAAHAGFEALAHRAELTAVETAETWDHLTMTCVLAGLAGVFCLLAGFGVTLALAMLVRDLAFGWLVVAALGVAYLVVAAAVFLGVRNRLRQWRPFESIREQLRKDGECLRSAHEQTGELTRAQRKRLLVLACAGDRLEWQLQVRRRAEGKDRATSRIVHLVSEGLGWLPGLQATRLGKGLSRWQRRFMWARALYGFFF